MAKLSNMIKPAKFEKRDKVVYSNKYTGPLILFLKDEVCNALGIYANRHQSSTLNFHPLVYSFHQSINSCERDIIHAGFEDPKTRKITSVLSIMTTPKEIIVTNIKEHITGDICLTYPSTKSLKRTENLIGEILFLRNVKTNQIHVKSSKPVNSIKSYEEYLH
jgi:hypothetical protein